MFTSRSSSNLRNAWPMPSILALDFLGQLVEIDSVLLFKLKHVQLSESLLFKLKYVQLSESLLFVEGEISSLESCKQQ